MLKRHLAKILTYFTHRITNAALEGLNNRIAGLHWRVLFFAEKGLLTAYDAMIHDEIKAWLRSF